MHFLHNNLTWKTFLSSVAKDITEHDGICSWRINKNTGVIFTRPIKTEDMDYINGLAPFSTYYIPENEVELLRKSFKIKATKDHSVVIPIDNLSLKGNKVARIRWAVNHNSSKNFIMSDSLNSMEDMFEFLKRWDDTCGDKYFQVRTGKNKYFFKNGLHNDGISLFVYDDKKLIGWGTLSNPDENGYSSYVVGKALCLDYSGLSEYIDVKLYEKGLQCGVKYVNLGGGVDGVVSYKLKFPGAYILKTYDVGVKLCDTKTL